MAYRDRRLVPGFKQPFLTDAAFVQHAHHLQDELEQVRVELLSRSRDLDKERECARATIMSENLAGLVCTSTCDARTGRMFVMDDPVNENNLDYMMRMRWFGADHNSSHGRRRCFRKEDPFLAEGEYRKVSSSFTASTSTCNDGGTTMADFDQSKSVCAGACAPLDIYVTMAHHRRIVESLKDPDTGHKRFLVPAQMCTVQNRVFSCALPAPVQQEALHAALGETSSYFPQRFVADVLRYFESPVPGMVACDTTTMLVFPRKTNIAGPRQAHNLGLRAYEYIIRVTAKHAMRFVHKNPRERQAERTVLHNARIVQNKARPAAARKAQA